MPTPTEVPQHLLDLLAVKDHRGYNPPFAPDTPVEHVVTLMDMGYNPPPIGETQAPAAATEPRTSVSGALPTPPRSIAPTAILQSAIDNRQSTIANPRTSVSGAMPTPPRSIPVTTVAAPSNGGHITPSAVTTSNKFESEPTNKFESEPVNKFEAETPNKSESKIDSLTPSRDPEKTCRATNKAGQPCRAYRLEASDLCIVHDGKAMRETATTLWNAPAPRPEEPARKAAIVLAEMPFTLNSRPAFLAFSEGIVRMQLAGAIPNSQLTALQRTLRILERALPAIDPPGAEEHARQIAEFLDLAPRIADYLDDQYAAERQDAVRDVGGKRDAFLQASRKHETYVKATRQNLDRLHTPTPPWLR
jgi:hypothetical protein